MPTESSTPNEPFMVESLPSHLVERARAVRAFAGLEEIAETIESVAADAERQCCDLEQLERLLTELEVEVLAARKSAQTSEQLTAATRDLKNRLLPYQGKMTSNRIEVLGNLYLERRLWEEFGIPRLSLFYMR
jgi:hypothetical protein